ncbi:hypothetical protein [Streptomyces sp. KL116D]|uniref:hypothetical protein n=1 Tax=Streptomyces sp. KL116D TaxID=3045152 RepID=UPI003556CA68
MLEILTHKIGACFVHLGAATTAFPHFEEMRRGSTSPDVHMGTAYLMAMLRTPGSCRRTPTTRTSPSRG